MDIRMELPLDSEGYLRRQCPRCEQLFKWHIDPDQDAGNTQPPDIYFCPYCGEPSPLDQWFTDEQVDYIQALASIEAAHMVERELKPSINRLNRDGGGFVSMALDIPEVTPPSPLFEPDDMVAVEPPCHPHEPLKVIEGWERDLHCLVCGERFVVASANE